MRYLVAAAALIGAASAAGAQMPPPSDGGAAGGSMTRANAIARAERRFAEMDTNHDGTVTRDEFTAYMEQRFAQRMGGDASSPPDGRHLRAGGMRMGAMGGKMFDRFDLNHDGRISLDEARQEATTMFDRRDTNHDGVITPDEGRGGWGGGPGGQGGPGGEAPPPQPQ